MLFCMLVSEQVQLQQPVQDIWAPRWSCQAEQITIHVPAQAPVLHVLVTEPLLHADDQAQPSQWLQWVHNSHLQPRPANTLLPPAIICCKAVPARPQAAAAQRQRRQGITQQSPAWAPAEDKSSPHCTATYQTLREQRAHSWVEWKRASYMPSCRRLAMLS